jgi:hypothetical protein
VGIGICGVVVLIRQPGAGDLVDQPTYDIEEMVRVLLGQGGRRDHHLGAVGLEDVHLLPGGLVRDADDHPVAALSADDRQPDAGVARRRLDDRSARLQRSVAFSTLDHRQCRAVLHTPTDAEELDLRVDRCGEINAEGAQPDEWRVADRVRNGLVDRRQCAPSQLALILDRDHADSPENERATRPCDEP